MSTAVPFFDSEVQATLGEDPSQLPGEHRVHRRHGEGGSKNSAMNRVLLDFYRCPQRFIDFSLNGPLSYDPGYFAFGENTICFGHSTRAACGTSSTTELPDLSQRVEFRGSSVLLPFDPSAVVDNLRRERYIANGFAPRSILSSRAVREVYYFLRPALAVSVRKHLQRLFHRGWDALRFPRWPVDTTVERILERCLILSMKAQNLKELPFVWFWPEGAASAAMVTHDVETLSGLNFVSPLMDVDEQFNIRASFQIIPQKRYRVPNDVVRAIRNRGFELNIQDLEHDGNLFSTREQFLKRANSINRYLRRYEALGFRAGRMYRNPDWYGALDVSYDMSIPTVAHLEAQRGGCCTIFPYFIGDILELPLTTIQDYCLLNILDDYTTTLWQQQVALIRESNGLASFLVHPDYIQRPKALEVYKRLLRHLVDLRANKGVWIALPREIDRWWRQRSQMSVVRSGNAWQIEGAGRERARLAYARLCGDRLLFTVEATGDLPGRSRTSS